SNVLAMRSIVNRVWAWHFGQGIAGNPNNFGQTGRHPTHPELLDWLVKQFIKDEMRFKSLHRHILLSETWRRSSSHPDPRSVQQLDPNNTSLAVFRVRRLEAEEMRDSILHVSGELNLRMGGVPVRPEINMEAALQPRQIMGTYAPAWQPSARPEQRHRRSIYAMKVRGLKDPTMDVFNQPSPDLSCERRETSTVTPQAFAMMNSNDMQNRAIAWAAELLSSDGRDEPTTLDDGQILEKAFLTAFGRRPDILESNECLSHWRKMTRRHESLSYAAINPPVQITRQAIEEMNGEPFTFTELLESNRHFVADLQFADCDARTRGLAEVCLVLLNSNEFVYID
ncbi:MAG: DUF1553 domain-containing protein, partial [Planctomycetaceae bacterium]|nr:DUF1553 domain-containing protein [Planctomycetaceae bacterium]